MKNINTLKILQKKAEQEGIDLPLSSFASIDKQIEDGKDYLAKLMGDRKIVEKEELTVINMDDEVKELGFNQYLKQLLNQPYFRNLYALRLFIRKCGAKAFYDNKVPENMVQTIVNEKGYDEEISIPKGMKISRAFKFFVGKNATILDELQVKYSQVINISSLSGKLCVSVDAMDFLTMSVNNNNWRSCMALDGEYGMGTVSYAADKYSFMVYLKSDKEDENLPTIQKDIKWNSKKWRCLMYFDKEYKTIVSTKQYPFTSCKLMEEAVELIKEAFNLQDWHYKTVSSVHDLNAFIGTKGLVYNDLESNSSKLLIHSLSKEPNSSMTANIVVGEDVKCPKCQSNDADYGESVICGECADRVICDNCGGVVAGDEMTYYIDGMDICEDCLSECAVICDCCDEIMWEDDERVVWTDTGEVYCLSCFQEIEDSQED